MRTLSDPNAKTLRSLFIAHVEEKKPLNANACMFVTSLPFEYNNLNGNLTETQRLLLALQIDYIKGVGPKTNPLLFTHSPQAKIELEDSREFLRVTCEKFNIKLSSVAHRRILKLLLPTTTVDEILFALIFHYVMLTLGTGEHNEEFKPAMAN